ncbi:hypothetical protein PoMZ_07886 [Pyricularia oryzae]|uniref:Uncharacterized protein n=1 Tax=Pyricularia oryzae TaxID=318829 RepID=A0A4P7NGA8_PYROR|nr:hypothetical protein PoMZ_07886 [Pyricularia oryzae]
MGIILWEGPSRKTWSRKLRHSKIWVLKAILPSRYIRRESIVILPTGLTEKLNLFAARPPVRPYSASRSRRARRPPSSVLCVDHARLRLLKIQGERVLPIFACQVGVFQHFLITCSGLSGVGLIESCKICLEALS